MADPKETQDGDGEGPVTKAPSPASDFELTFSDRLVATTGLEINVALQGKETQRRINLPPDLLESRNKILALVKPKQDINSGRVKDYIAKQGLRVGNFVILDEKENAAVQTILCNAHLRGSAGVLGEEVRWPGLSRQFFALDKITNRQVFNMMVLSMSGRSVGVAGR